MHVPRFHPDNTTPKGDGWIWVFGSNLAGRHGKGAAKVAKVNFGAAYGVGAGPTGRSYAIPTKGAQLQVLSLSVIEQSVADFVRYASACPQLRFFVTRVGCGLAGFSDEQIGPLFADAPMNCSLPIEWMLHVRNRGTA